LIEVENLSFGYSRKKFLKNICVKISPGEIISLVGANGCGKSTLLKCICGLLRTSKSISLNGKYIEEYSLKQRAKIISFLPQLVEKINSISVYELIMLGAKSSSKTGWFISEEDLSRVENIMTYMNLQHLRQKPVENISGGEKQRALIATILAQNAPVIILDEPVTYMDMQNQYNLLDVIKSLQKDYDKTVVSVFHDVNHAMEISDKIIMMKEGEILYAGNPDDIINEKNIFDVFEMKVHICRLHKFLRPVLPSAKPQNTSRQEEIEYRH